MRPSMLAFSLRCNDIILGCAFSPAFTWMLEFFCMIMMYNEIRNHELTTIKVFLSEC